MSCPHGIGMGAAACILCASQLSEVAFIRVIGGLPIHVVTPAGIATGLVEAYLQEPGPLGSLSRAHLRRSTGKERSSKSRNLLPFPLPTRVGAAVLSRGDAFADATACSNSRSTREWRSEGYLGLDIDFDIFWILIFTIRL